MPILIAVEGLDGVGKSTLVTELHKAMEADRSFYRWIMKTKEPGSPLAYPNSEIRKLVLETPELRPLERELLFCTDALIHKRFIDNQRNAIILTDRSKWTHLSYVRGYLKTRKLDYDEYTLMKDLYERVCAKPDCIIYLKGSVELMRERQKDKPKDAIERNGDDYFEAVYETFEDLVTEAEHNGERLLTLNATDSVETNVAKAISYLKDVFRSNQLSTGLLESKVDDNL